MTDTTSLGLSQTKKKKKEIVVIKLKEFLKQKTTHSNKRTGREVRREIHVI